MFFGFQSNRVTHRPGVPIVIHRGEEKKAGNRDPVTDIQKTDRSSLTVNRETPTLQDDLPLLIGRCEITQGPGKCEETLPEEGCDDDGHHTHEFEKNVQRWP